MLQPLYGAQERIVELVGYQMVKGQDQYLCKYAPTTILRKHLHLYEKQGYTPINLRQAPIFFAHGMVEVDWLDSWEPRHVLDANEDTKTMVDEYNKIYHAINNTLRLQPSRPNPYSQGTWDAFESRPTHPLITQPELAHHISIKPSVPINPDKDITPTGAFCIYARQVHPDPLSLEDSTRLVQLVDVYDPHGHYKGSLTADRCLILHKAFATSKAHRPELHERFGNKTFAAAIADLLHRYKDGYKLKTAKKQCTRLYNHWATPDKYMQALIASFSLTTERFASPLNFCPTMREYYAMYDEDQVFGATHDAFSTHWSGASQSNPEYEPEDMEKAVRWALLSAIESVDPTLTVFVLPKWQDTGYYKWLSHPYVHVIADVDKKQFKFKTPDYWKTGQNYASNPKWNVLFFVVANPIGLTTFVSENKLLSTFGDASKAIGGAKYTPKVPQPNNTPPDEPESYGLYPSKAFRKAETQQQSPNSWTCNNLAYDPPCWDNAPPLLHDPDSIIYTDGSAKETKDYGHRIGSGIYCPALDISI